MAKKCYPTSSGTAKTSKVPSMTILGQIVDLYVSSCRPDFSLFASSFRKKILTGKLSKSKIADEFFHNNHFWALKSFHKSVAYIPLKKAFISHYPATLSSFSNFEVLYDWTYKWMKRKYVTQLYIYDIALRFAILEPTGRLMPNQKVYLHAKPMKAYKDLHKKGYLSFAVKVRDAIIDRSLFPSVFTTLTAYEIEDLLCQIEKSLERNLLRKSGTSKFEKQLDKLTSLL